MSRKDVKREKVDVKMQDLEKRIKENLERTGLVTNIRIRLGDLNDPENPPYIEFRKNENTRRTLGNCRLLRQLMLEILTMRGEIDGISYSQPYEGLWRVRLELNPEALIHDEIGLKKQLLFDIYKATEGYIKRYENPAKKVM